MSDFAVERGIVQPAFERLKQSLLVKVPEQDLGSESENKGSLKPVLELIEEVNEEFPGIALKVGETDEELWIIRNPADIALQHFAKAVPGNTIRYSKQGEFYIAVDSEGVYGDVFTYLGNFSLKDKAQTPEAAEFLKKEVQKIREANRIVDPMRKQFKSDIERVEKNTIEDPYRKWLFNFHQPATETYDGNQKYDISIGHHRMRIIDPTPVLGALDTSLHEVKRVKR